ncbi:hypothetical protein JMUB7542_27800 [Staphylococcus aureus]
MKLCSNNEIDVHIVNERPTYLSETVFIICLLYTSPSPRD